MIEHYGAIWFILPTSLSEIRVGCCCNIELTAESDPTDEIKMY